jgi:hypothetical protein
MNLKPIALVVALAASGCATNDHIYNADGACLTCFNNPFTGEAINHDGTNNKHMEVAKSPSTQKETQTQTNASNPQSFERHIVKLHPDTNVDVVFIALKEEFKFASPEEVRREMGSYADFKLKSVDYQWEMVPHVTYTMGSAREVMGESAAIKLKMDKRTDTSSTVTISYSLPSSSNKVDAIGAHLLKRVKSALAM